MFSWICKEWHAAWCQGSKVNLESDTLPSEYSTHPICEIYQINFLCSSVVSTVREESPSLLIETVRGEIPSLLLWNCERKAGRC